MAGIKNRRARFSSRPLYATLFLMTLLATYSLFLRVPQLPSTAPYNILSARANDGSCDDVHQAKDQCAWVKDNCTEDEPGLLSYLTFYYCGLPTLKPAAFTLLTLWLGLLFSTIGIAASDFFSVNLSTIATVLGLPESLAGVTFLAFGNGSPDVFSTFAAMGSNSGSMAVGELIGAAGFITAVVAGSMALVREFKVSRKTFVRDIVFFIVAISFTMLFLLDGKMHLWECGSMIAFYIFYVCFVVAWHWFSARRKRRRTKEAASRSHYSVAPSYVGDDVEPYRDNVDEEDGDGNVGQRGPSQHLPDISALEAGTRIDGETSSQDDDDEDKKRYVASEMTSSMRVNRPRGSRARSTMGLIRPSLVGALEFRSVLSSLARSRNMRLAPLQRGYSDHNSAGLLARSSTDLDHMEPYRDDPATAAQVSSRYRALSSGDVPRNLHNDSIGHASLPIQPSASRDAPLLEPGYSASTERRHDQLLSVAQRAMGGEQERTRTPSPAPPSITIGGHLAPPDMLGSRALPSSELAAEPSQDSTPVLSLHIPSPNLQPSQASSPSLSPFPGYHDSPGMGGQQSPGRPLLQPKIQTYDHIPGLDLPGSPRPVRWWPYWALPAPHTLWRTLLPTLQGWREKSIWDKVFSIFSAPSVFLLVITLPVVEADPPDEEDDEDENAHRSNHTPVGPGVHAPAISVENQASLIPETEWQEYRRRAHSVRSPSSAPSRRRTSTGNTPDAPYEGRFPFPNQASAGAGSFDPRPWSEGGMESEATTDDEPPAWNRWLVAVQIFVGPLFTSFIIWAKYMDQPVGVFFKMALYCLLGSLVLLAVLRLSTSPDKKPRYHFLFCFLGFIISIAWISTIAEEVVGVLKAVGVILGMSEAILGLTIFAVGNSVGDLVADITVARLGYPVMALYGCFSPRKCDMRVYFHANSPQVCLLRRSNAQHTPRDWPGWNVHDDEKCQTRAQESSPVADPLRILPHRSHRHSVCFCAYRLDNAPGPADPGPYQQVDDDQEDRTDVDHVVDDWCHHQRDYRSYWRLESSCLSRRETKAAFHLHFLCIYLAR